MNYSIVNLGCKVNRAESDACAALLESLGWRASALDAADVVVVNTCTVTAEADKKTRKAVRHALSKNAAGRVIVTGCAAAMTPEVFTSMSARVQVVSKAALLDAIDNLVKQTSTPVSPVDHDAVRPQDDVRARSSAPNEPDSPSSCTGELFARHAVPKAQHITRGGDLAIPLPVGDAFRTRVGVKIQDGCNNACTFCIVHVARGKSSSVPGAQVVEQCRALHEAGVREIVLTGINLGCYRDPDGAYPTLTSLLQALLDVTSSAPTRFRIGSIEPRDVTPELIELMAASGGCIARHLHLPLQSGSTKVLREMARPYTAEAFEQLVARMRQAMPQLALSTDVIVGFPGETDDDFANTVAVCERSRFMKLHVFPYSLREGTPAAARTDQVSPEVKQARAATLRALSDRLAREDLERRSGTTELVLVEQNGVGTTESYHEIPVPEDAPAGVLIPVTFDANRMVR